MLVIRCSLKNFYVYNYTVLQFIRIFLTIAFLHGFVVICLFLFTYLVAQLLHLNFMHCHMVCRSIEFYFYMSRNVKEPPAIPETMLVLGSPGKILSTAYQYSLKFTQLSRTASPAGLHIEVHNYSRGLLLYQKTI